MSRFQINMILDLSWEGVRLTDQSVQVHASSASKPAKKIGNIYAFHRDCREAILQRSPHVNAEIGLDHRPGHVGGQKRTGKANACS